MNDWLKPGPRGLATLLLVLTALAGALGGITLDRLLLRPEAGELAAEAVRPAPPESRDTRFAPRQRYLGRMAAELELTADQRARIDSLLSAQQARMRSLSEEMQPPMRQIVRETRAAMDEILTAEQRERMRELRGGDHMRLRGPDAMRERMRRDRR